MTAPRFPRELRVFATCPPSPPIADAAYLDTVRSIAEWCDASGFEGLLVYTDNGLVDPWLVAQEIIRATKTLTPLVAVQPAYLHPYAAAKLIATMAALHGRSVHLNLVAGGFVKDLTAIGDSTPHDQRYERLVAFGEVVQRLVQGDGPLTVDNAFYRTNAVSLVPPVRPDLRPLLFVSGSSAAGMAAARALGAVAVEYPAPASAYPQAAAGMTATRGLRVGIIARESSAEAWEIARARFPESRKGQLTHQMAMKVSDSAWHKQLSTIADNIRGQETPYWLVPFENYKTFCPYLVGSYAEVGDVLASYLQAGFGTFILDVPAAATDLPHIGIAFDYAVSQRA